MAKVVGIHEIELKPEVGAEDFERFLTEELSRAPSLPGTHTRFLKDDRGERSGKYLMLLEVESVEARDRLWPTAGGTSPEVDRWFTEHGDTWNRFFAMGETRWTDYVEVGD